MILPCRIVTLSTYRSATPCKALQHGADASGRAMRGDDRRGHAVAAARGERPHLCACLPTFTQQCRRTVDQNVHALDREDRHGEGDRHADHAQQCEPYHREITPKLKSHSLVRSLWAATRHMRQRGETSKPVAQYRRAAPVDPLEHCSKEAVGAPNGKGSGGSFVVGGEKVGDEAFFVLAGLKQAVKLGRAQFGEQDAIERAACNAPLCQVVAVQAGVDMA